MIYVLCTNNNSIIKLDRIGSGEVAFSDIIQIILCELEKYPTPFSLFYNSFKQSIYIDYETHRIMLYNDHITIVTIRDDQHCKTFNINYATLDLKIFAELAINDENYRQ